MIDEAKRKAASANSSTANTVDRLKDIKGELDKIKVTPGDSNLTGIMDDVDKSGEGPGWGSMFFRRGLSSGHLVPHMEIVMLLHEFLRSVSLVVLVRDLLNTIPTLEDKLSEMENLTSQLSSASNISENIKKIKELIEKARDAANRVNMLSTTVFMESRVSPISKGPFADCGSIDG